MRQISDWKSKNRMDWESLLLEPCYQTNTIKYLKNLAQQIFKIMASNFPFKKHIFPLFLFFQDDLKLVRLEAFDEMNMG